MTALFNKMRLPNSTNKTPTVFLLGWGGAHDPQLNKYSDIYKKKGCDVTCYTAPFGRLHGRSFASYEKFAQDFYQRALVDVRNDVDRPIVFHAFSMNGISLFIKFWDMLSSSPNGDALKKRVKGFVFDSGPSDTVAQTSALAFSLATFSPQSGLYANIGRLFLYIVVYVHVSISRATYWLKYITSDPLVFESEVAYYRILKITDLPRNQLYLYSTADSMIRYKDVRRFIAHQKVIGAVIESKCWPDSSHVQHLRFHPDEYQNLCSTFLDKILKKPTL